MLRERGWLSLRGRAVCFAVVFSALLIMVPFVPGAAASGHQEDGCDEAGYDIECNELGSVRMPSTQKIEGEPERITASIWLNSDMEEEDARWWMFKVDSEHGHDVVHATVDAFATVDGPVITERESTDGPVEQEYFVDILDLPVQEEIRIEMTVGSTEVGAYEVEVQVIPFDRGYETLSDGEGGTYNLYSSTTLSITEATDPFGEGDDAPWIALVREVPGLSVSLMVAAVALVGVGARARGS